MIFISIFHLECVSVLLDVRGCRVEKIPTLKNCGGWRMEPINQALRAGNEDGYVLLKDGKLYKWYPKIRQTWVCLGFCSSWRVEDVWLYTQDHLARLWLMLTRHQRHCVNPNVNDRLFLGAGLKYVFIMCHSLFGEMFRKWSNLTNSYFSNGWFVENHHRLGRKIIQQPSRRVKTPS